MGVLAAQTMLRRVSGDYNNNDSGIKNVEEVINSENCWMPPRPPKKIWISHFFANEETPPSHEEFPTILNCSPQPAVSPLTNGPSHLRAAQKQSPVVTAPQLPPTPTPTPTVTPTSTPTPTPSQLPPLHQPAAPSSTSPYPSDSGSPLHSQDEDHGNEPRRRAGSGTREVHNKLEKNRRAHLKECFEVLKRQLPSYQDEKKFSNLAILHSALKYIQSLKRKELEAEHEMEKLAREKIAAQQRLSELRKDLGGWDGLPALPLLQGEAIPKRPPSSAAASPTSTSTASEREERMVIDEEDLSNPERPEDTINTHLRRSPTDLSSPSAMPSRTYAGARNGVNRENFSPESADVVRSSPTMMVPDAPRSPGVPQVFRLPGLTATSTPLAPVTAFTSNATITNSSTASTGNTTHRSTSPSTITYATPVPVAVPVPVTVPGSVTVQVPMSAHAASVSTASPNSAPVVGNGAWSSPLGSRVATPPLLQPVAVPLSTHHIQLPAQMMNNGRWLLASPGVHVIPGDPLTIALPQSVGTANGNPSVMTSRARELPSDLRLTSSGSAATPGDVSATAAITMPAISVNKMMTAGVAIFNDRQLVKPETASRPQEASLKKAHVAGDHNGHILTTAVPPRLAPTSTIAHVVSPLQPSMSGSLSAPLSASALPRQLSGAHHTMAPIAVSPVISQGSPVTHILTTSGQLGKMVTPLLKTVGQVPMVGSTYATLVKPMVVVSTPSTTVSPPTQSQPHHSE